MNRNIISNRIINFCKFDRSLKFIIYSKQAATFWLFLTLSLTHTNAFAQGTSGLYNSLFGAKALGQGNAFVARADDATAVHFNPAGLTQLKRPQTSLGAAFVLPSIDYHDNGASEDMARKISIVPNVFFAGPIIEDKIAAGLGVTVPYGLSGKWNSDGFSKYLVTKFNLQVIDINPSLSFKPFSFLSIGAGFNYYYLKSFRRKHINVGLLNSILTGRPIVPGTPDGRQKLKEHGDAFGYNIGLMFNITPRQSVGISFRSKADIHVKGKLKASNLSGATAAVFGTTEPLIRTRTRATIPEMLSVGYAYRYGDLWGIEADFQWTNWSRFDVLKYSFRPTNFLLEADDEDVRDWHNTISVALGGEYKVNEALKVRGGYAFHETPVPNKTFDTTVPQSNRHGVFVGLGYNFGKNKGENSGGEKWIDLAYGAIFYEDRHINNAVGNSVGANIDGRYDLMTHIVAVNFNLSF